MLLIVELLLISVSLLLISESSLIGRSKYRYASDPLTYASSFDVLTCSRTNSPASCRSGPDWTGSMFMRPTDSRIAQYQKLLGSRDFASRLRAMQQAVCHCRSTAPFCDCRCGGAAPIVTPWDRRSLATSPQINRLSKSVRSLLGNPPASIAYNQNASAIVDPFKSVNP